MKEKRERKISRVHPRELVFEMKHLSTQNETRKRPSETGGEVGERTRDGSSEFKLVTLEDEDEKRAERPLALPRHGPSTPTFSRPPVGTSTETCAV